MKKIILPILLMASVSFTACNDWLDVKGQNSKKEEQQFSEFSGFKSALTGAYMSMAETSLYGENLTISTIEMLANTWTFTDDESIAPLKYQLAHHQYEGDYALSTMQGIYANLFNTIAQANVIIKNAENYSGTDINLQLLDVVRGEAYAIRAFCQFDVLRLFGEVPGGSKKVELPYSFTTGIDEMPDYYGWSDYIKLLKADLHKADSLLKENDPIMDFTFSQLNQPNGMYLDDDYFYYRQSRFNYWAVQALQARFHLYIGETTKAYQYAMAVINATDVNGAPVKVLSGLSDLASGYNALPNECLFYLSKYDINTTANAVLIGGRQNVQSRETNYVLTAQRLVDMYASIAPYTGGHNRYNNLWNRTVIDPYAASTPALKKYWRSDDVAASMLNHNIIPMLRMSEMYLIAMETTTDLAQANELYTTYMNSCACTVLPESAYTTLEDVKAEVINEYRREFVAEGQMFYLYKRMNATSMLWSDDVLTEESYIIPLPRTEYNPEHLNQ